MTPKMVAKQSLGRKVYNGVARVIRVANSLAITASMVVSRRQDRVGHESFEHLAMTGCHTAEDEPDIG